MPSGHAPPYVAARSKGHSARQSGIAAPGRRHNSGRSTPETALPMLRRALHDREDTRGVTQAAMGRLLLTMVRTRQRRCSSTPLSVAMKTWPTRTWPTTCTGFFSRVKVNRNSRAQFLARMTSYPTNIDRRRLAWASALSLDRCDYAASSLSPCQLIHGADVRLRAGWAGIPSLSSPLTRRQTRCVRQCSAMSSEAAAGRTPANKRGSPLRAFVSGLWSCSARHRRRGRSGDVPRGLRGTCRCRAATQPE